MTSEQQRCVIAEASSWLGTPFHHRARVKGPRGGVDCAQFAIAVYSDAGIIEPFDPEWYPPDWHLHQGLERYLSHVRAYADSLKQDETWEVGDLLTFRFGPAQPVSHAGIYVGENMMIHALYKVGVVKQDLDSRAFGRWFSGAWRLRNGVA
ncbi:hypothetical protein AMK68_03315 [candidate division KD3-62 bacterium DG_56]|uniref:NlpC/P60 domain-containing protein n=1 Tax=candidate division KD3-62 bacterium DG_56 TaxID=1704032 RepID=A0A0S7XMS7_9BACT|nr:MAG: hypothetical protein AMK68_03315 [candidate division KD3-62 bacterium DG_56]